MKTTENARKTKKETQWRRSLGESSEREQKRVLSERCEATSEKKQYDRRARNTGLVMSEKEAE